MSTHFLWSSNWKWFSSDNDSRGSSCRVKTDEICRKSCEQAQDKVLGHCRPKRITSSICILWLSELHLRLFRLWPNLCVWLGRRDFNFPIRIRLYMLAAFSTSASSFLPIVLLAKGIGPKSVNHPNQPNMTFEVIFMGKLLMLPEIRRRYFLRLLPMSCPYPVCETHAILASETKDEHTKHTHTDAHTAR